MVIMGVPMITSDIDNEGNCSQAPAVHTFTVDGRNFALDINSGIFFEVDDLAREVVELYISGKNAHEISQQLGKKHGEGTVTQAIEEFERLKASGFLFADDVFSSYEPDSDHIISSICMMISQDCNLRCAYCYAETGTFGRERLLMSKEIAEKAIEFLFKHCGNSRFLTVVFFGGEPLLNFDVLKHTVDYAKRLGGQCNKEVGFTITTNGTLLTATIKDYLSRNGIGMMISLDGMPEIQDKMRPFSDGKGSYDKVYQNIAEMLREPASNNFSVRGTMTRENIDLLGMVKHLASIGCRCISVEPCYTLNGKLGILEKDVYAVKEEYTNLAREYIKAAKSGKYFSFSQFEDIMNQTQHANLHVVSCGAGASYIAISADGGLYPCHRLVGTDGYSFGNVRDGFDNLEILQLFKNTHVNNREKCSSCWAKYVCGGGCRAHAINFNKSIYEPYSIDCDLMKHIIKLGAYIHSEVNRGRRPSSRNTSPCSIR